MTDSFYDRFGGQPAVDALAADFYARVLADPLLLPLFRNPSENHAERMAWWLAELFGGPKLHSRMRGGFPAMVRAHAGLSISERQRERWAEHMLAASLASGMSDTLFAEYAGYVDIASRLAMRSSQ